MSAVVTDVSHDLSKHTSVFITAIFGLVILFALARRLMAFAGLQDDPAAPFELHVCETDVDVHVDSLFCDENTARRDQMNIKRRRERDAWSAVK